MNMSLNSSQVDHLRSAIRTGLSPLIRPEPKCLAEWADENFYLSSESSYIEGSWETLPFQVAIINAMGHPDIEQVNLIKSKRVGYSQMIRAALGYFAEHKKRHQIVYQPTDKAAEGFMKVHIEPMIRDVPAVKSISPWLGKKHRDSTLKAKRFANGKQLWCLGGATAHNFREKSSDVVIYDELAAFDDDVEKEGSVTMLGDGRLEGSAFPKSIRGSTPKIEPDEEGNGCQITMAGREAECYFRFHLPCPHCDQEQVLRWGD
jgi:phage terminase large subunit GpA-like protein